MISKEGKFKRRNKYQGTVKQRSKGIKKKQIKKKNKDSTHVLSLTNPTQNNPAYKRCDSACNDCYVQSGIWSRKCMRDKQVGSQGEIEKYV